MSHFRGPHTAGPSAVRYRLMRKCEACGYLLFGAADSCKHCGAVLAAPAPPALVASGAPSPPHAPPPAPFASDPVPPAVALPAPPVAYAAPPPLPAPVFAGSPVARDSWDAPDAWVATRPYAAPKPKRARGVLLALIVVVSMAFGWVAVERALRGDSLPAGTSAFVAGHGVYYSSPDRTFDAQFPAMPTVERRTLPVASSSATTSLAQVQTDDYEVVAASMVLPVAIPSGQIDEALHGILDEGVVATNGEVVSEQRIVHAGAVGVEVRAKVSDGYGARVMVLSSGNHVFMLGVHSKRGTDRLYDALVRSFVMR